MASQPRTVATMSRNELINLHNDICDELRDGEGSNEERDELKRLNRAILDELDERDEAAAAEPAVTSTTAEEPELRRPDR